MSEPEQPSVSTGTQAPLLEPFIAYEIVLDLTHVLTQMQRTNSRHWSVWFERSFRGLVIVALVFSLVCLCFQHGDAVWLAALMVMFVLLVLLYPPRPNPAREPRWWRKSPYRNYRARVELTREKMSIVGELSEGSFQWPLVTRVRQYPDGILLALGPGDSSCYWLPDSKLVAGTAEEARRLVSNQVPSGKIKG